MTQKPFDLQTADFDVRMAIPTRNRIAALRRWDVERTPEAAAAYYAAYHAWLRCFEALQARALDVRVAA